MALIDLSDKRHLNAYHMKNLLTLLAGKDYIKKIVNVRLTSQNGESLMTSISYLEQELNIIPRKEEESK